MSGVFKLGTYTKLAINNAKVEVSFWLCIVFSIMVFYIAIIVYNFRNFFFIENILWLYFLNFFGLGNIGPRKNGDISLNGLGL